MEICVELHLSARPCARGCRDSGPDVKELGQDERNEMKLEETSAEGRAH